MGDRCFDVENANDLCDCVCMANANATAYGNDHDLPLELYIDLDHGGLEACFPRELSLR